MRASLLLAGLAVFSSGCSFSSPDPEPIRAATVLGATVDALPFDVVWDRDVFGPNAPDVFVEIRRIDETVSGGSVSAFRTSTAPNARRADLPLVLAPRAPLFGTASTLGIQDRIIVTVYDDDSFGENDLMFASDTLRLAPSIAPSDTPGSERTLQFQNAEARVRLRVRWESEPRSRLRS